MSRSKKALAPVDRREASESLIALAQEAAALARALLASEGELSPELERALDINAEALVQKTDAYQFTIQEFEAQADLWSRREKACAAQRRKFEGQVERMKGRIKEALKTMGATEVRGAHYGFQLRRSAPKLVIENEAALPADCKMIVQRTVVDTEKVKAALRDGFEIPGAKLEESGALYCIEVAEEK